MSWKRWFRYGRAKVAAAAKDLERTLDRKEAELDRETSDEPWLRDDDDVPSFDEAKERIEREAAAGGARSTTSRGAGSGDPTFDLAEQQRAADERLRQIRESLGVDGEADPPPPA